jgi:hypothetical protein
MSPLPSIWEVYRLTRNNSRCPRCGMDEFGLTQELIDLHERNCKH